MGKKAHLRAVLVAVLVVCALPVGLARGQEAGPSGATPEEILLSTAEPWPSSYYDDVQGYEICWHGM